MWSILPCSSIRRDVVCSLSRRGIGNPGINCFNARNVGNRDANQTFCN